MFGGTLEFTRNITSRFGIAGELNGYGEREDDTLLLFIGPRIGRFHEGHSLQGRPQLEHVFVQVQYGVGGLASTPGGRVIKIGGGVELFFPCSRIDRGHHCSVGFDAGYRRGPKGHRELSGFQSMLRLGVGFGG